VPPSPRRKVKVEESKSSELKKEEKDDDVKIVSKHAGKQFLQRPKKKKRKGNHKQH